MSQWVRLVSNTYRGFLRLYPGRFREEFAEEMAWVFTLSLEGTAREGTTPVMRMLAREIGELPVSILSEHLHERRKQAMGLLTFDPKGEIQLFRWGARLLSLFPLAFYLLIILLNEDVRAEPAPALLIQGLLTLAIIVAWIWEKEGGTILMAGAPILLGLYTLSGLRFDFSPPRALLVGGAVALPYLLIGWLFYSVGRHSSLADEVQPDDGRPRSKRRVFLFVAGLSALVVVVAVLFLSSLVTPSGQGQIAEVPAGPCSAIEERIRSSVALPVLPSPLPKSMKGYELYGYQRDSDWYFTFEVGLNRIRTAEDIPAAIEGTSYTVQGVDQLRQLLSQMPQGEYLFWCGYETPDGDFISELRSLSEELGLNLSFFND